MQRGVSRRGSLAPPPPPPPPLLETWERASETMVELAWEMPRDRRFSGETSRRGSGGAEHQYPPTPPHPRPPSGAAWGEPTTLATDPKGPLPDSPPRPSRRPALSPWTMSSWRCSGGRAARGASFSTSLKARPSLKERGRFPAWTCRSCSKSLSAALRSQFFPGGGEQEEEGGSSAPGPPPCPKHSPSPAGAQPLTFQQVSGQPRLCPRRADKIREDDVHVQGQALLGSSQAAGSRRGIGPGSPPLGPQRAPGTASAAPGPAGRRASAAP